MKHFEDLWVSAEESVKLHYHDPVTVVVSKIKSQLNNLCLIQDQNERIEIMGQILLDLAFISEKLNIDVFSALKGQLDELRSELFDPS